MIRQIHEADSSTVIELAVTSGLFAANETEILQQMMADYFSGSRENGHVCIIDEEDEPLGVAYYEPAAATDGTWYLTMIGVRRDSQGHGRGSALLQYVEAALHRAGQRVLLVETSGSPDFERTRAFYTKCGYDEEARIRDYWTAGDDLVVFRKALNAK